MQAFGPSGFAGRGKNGLKISDFAAYAQEKYKVIEERQENMPGVLALYHPKTREPLAILMQDSDGPAETGSCDLKCGSSALREQKPYLKPSPKTLGEGWTRIEFDDRTEESVVYKLLAKAILLGTQQDGCTIVLASQLPKNETIYKDTPLPHTPQKAASQKPKQPLPPQLARQTLEEDTLQKDTAFAVLRDVQNYTDEQIFTALSAFASKRTLSSPLFKKCPERAAQLFGAAWRAASEYHEQGVSLFALCFGGQVTKRWYPLHNAQVYRLPKPHQQSYELDESRNYFYKDGCWYESAYPQVFRNKAFFAGFLHETERLLRRYLKIGSPLKESPNDAWATPYIEAALEADRKAQLEAARPKISIDLAGLAKIRADAALTRESLLTEEERSEAESPAPGLPQTAETAPAPKPAETPGSVPLPSETAPSPAPGQAQSAPLESSENALLTPLECRALQMLLAGQDPAALLKAEHQMPSILADRVNDALFDEIGDTVLECENDRLHILEEYQEDLKELLGRS